MSALCRMRGWVADDDWQAVRKAALGAASRRDDDPGALRLVAAAQLWLSFVDDVPARRLIDQRDPRDDGLAAAIAGLAGAVRGAPSAGLAAPSRALIQWTRLSEGT